MPVSTPEPQLGRSVSLEEAARLLRISRRTVYYRIQHRQLDTIRTMGGSQRVLVESIRQAQGAACDLFEPV